MDTDIINIALPYLLGIAVIVIIWLVSFTTIRINYNEQQPRITPLDYKAIQSRYNAEYYKRNRKRILAQRRAAYNARHPKQNIIVIVTK